MTVTALHPIKSAHLQGDQITHGFFTREGGVSRGVYQSLNGGLGSSDDLASVTENRNRMAAHLGVAPAHLLSLYQIHSPTCVTLTKAWSLDQRPHADAMVTDRAGLALGIGTADCGPLLFADHEARVIGAAHAGWKGALSGVIKSTIEAMEKLGASRVRLCAVLGPTISQAAYEVGPEFRATFMSHDAHADHFFTRADGNGKCHFDLPAFIVHGLERARIGAIENLALCTYADEQRFLASAGQRIGKKPITDV